MVAVNSLLCQAKPVKAKEQEEEKMVGWCVGNCEAKWLIHMCIIPYGGPWQTYFCISAANLEKNVNFLHLNFKFIFTLLPC